MLYIFKLRERRDNLMKFSNFIRFFKKIKYWIYPKKISYIYIPTKIIKRRDKIIIKIRNGRCIYDDN